MKKLLIGIIVSSILIYFSIKGIEFDKIFMGMNKAKYAFLIPVVLLVLCISFLKSFRWGIILSPMEKISQKKLYPITCVGLMAIVLIPMRIGELMRPYLLKRKSHIPLSSALGTIYIEKVFDSLMLLLIMFFIIFSSNLPGWVLKAGYSFLITFVILVCLMFTLYFKTQISLKLIRPLLNKFPQKINMRIEQFVKNFVDGFKIISSPKRFVYTLLLSILIWLFSALAIYSISCFQNLQLPLLSSFVVLFITTIGLSLPSAPGFLGNFQFACIMALSMFNLPKSDALAFSMVFYFFGICINIFLGLVFLPIVGLSFDEIKQSFNFYRNF